MKISQIVIPFSTILFAPLAAWTQADGDDPVEQLESIIVTAPGVGDYESATPRVDSSAIVRTGNPDVLGALSRNIPGISLADAQNNPFQPNLNYHGFVISPLQGGSQGLSIYLDGARFNQPFGDTVNFDLLPEAAINQITIESVSPAYGLNALGGALVVQTKTGNSAPGGNIWGALGDYGRIESGGEIGISEGPWSAYAALESSEENGWRRFSPSSLQNAYVDLGYEGEDAGVHFKLIGADSDLTGNGTSPIELLKADRQAVFSWPDNTQNEYARVSAHPWMNLSETTRLKASLYLQRLRQNTLNGDAADIEACEDDEDFLCLETDEDEATPLFSSDNFQISNILGIDDDSEEPGAAYGVLNRSKTRTTASGMLLQIEDKRPFNGDFNHLRLGASYDISRTQFSAETELGQLTPTRSVDGLGPLINQPEGGISLVDLIVRSEYTGLYVAETLPLGHGLSVDFDLRYNSALIKLEDQIGEDLNGRHRYTRINPGVALNYAHSSGLGLQFGYAETNRAPTPAELSCAEPDDPCSLTNFFVNDPPLEQIVARTWHAGINSRMDIDDWTLQTNIQLYRAINGNDIQFIASDIRGRGYFQNIGTTRRQGFDIDLSAKKASWVINAGYAFTDATFRTPLTLNSPDNPLADENGNITAQPGDSLPTTPRHRGTISLYYESPRLQLGGNFQAQSGQYFVGDEANLQPKTDDFYTINLHGAVALSESASLFGKVSNVFDREYETFGAFSETDEIFLFEAPNATDPRSLGPGAPRRWQIGLRARF